METIKEYVNIGICGNVDDGKSTFVGVLSGSELDDGKGKARAHVFQHKHEHETGRTSDISEKIIGFDKDGIVSLLDPNTNRKITDAQIIEKSNKIVYLHDLAGHENYFKTTTTGLMYKLIDYAIVIVAGNTCDKNGNIQRMTKQHIGLCYCLNIPFIIIITKIDITPSEIIKHTETKIKELFSRPAFKKFICNVTDEESLNTSINIFYGKKFLPIFKVSNVTGEGMDFVKRFIHRTITRFPVTEESLEKPFEMYIDKIYNINGIGLVAIGTPHQGTIEVGKKAFIGPLYLEISIKNIQEYKINKEKTTIKQICGIHFKVAKNQIFTFKRGMIITAIQQNPVRSFNATVSILNSSTSIRDNYQPIIHIGPIRQSAKIKILSEHEKVNIDGRDVITLRSGDKAEINFTFVFRPVYAKEGMKILFREGSLRGYGTINKIII